MRLPHHLILALLLTPLAPLAIAAPASMPADAASLRESLLRDRQTVEEAAQAMPAPAAVADLRKQLADARRAAVTNVAKLTDDGIQAAHENYDKLKPLVEQLNAVHARRLAIVEAMSRRGQLLASLRRLAPSDATFSADAEAKLSALAEKALGTSLAVASTMPPPGRGTGPDDPAQYALWFYRTARAIEAWNATVEPAMTKGEAKAARLINNYREALGVMPMELDARIVQAARRHSKEMVDLKFFGHNSPTPGEKTPADRMRSAGYGGRAWSENLTTGSATAEEAFGHLFDSAPHHKEMVAAQYTAMGVGRWDTAWTQNMAIGPRLAFATPAEREQAVIRGKVLDPQDEEKIAHPASDVIIPLR